jgi:hypothetical protein
VAGAKPSSSLHVSVALSTLIGIDEEPGEIDGVGPITAAQARLIAFDPTSTWRRLVTDPLGRLIDYGRTTYRPPVALADHVRARDRTCRFPNCNRRAANCELDHRRPWEDGGTTCPENVGPLCARHHHLKHEAGWTLIRLADGTSRWISPLGRTYDEPPAEYPVDRTADPPPAA